MPRNELQLHELMEIVAQFFESHGVHYHVVGSMASMAYGEPRFTNDVDMVAEMSIDNVGDLCEAFSAPEFYLSETAIRDAIIRRGQFNIIHPSSGMKVDVIVPKDSEFARSEKARVRRISSPGEYSVWFGSPEDVILYKLQFYQRGGSEKHLRDIAGMIKLLRERIDLAYIEAWVRKLGVSTEWDLIRNSPKEEIP